MAVRFLPAPEASATSEAAPDRGDLAEVIDLRTRLARSAPSVDTSADSVTGPAPVETPSPELIAERTAADDGVRLLARRARSSGELRRELQQLGHAADEVDAVVLEFEGSLYLDDLGLGRVVAEGLRERKRASRMQIRTKLRERLLPDGVIEQVLAEFDEDGEHELLRVAAADRARRLTGLDRQVAERRLLGFLARRGWSGERAARVAREALDAAAARGSVRFR